MIVLPEIVAGPETIVKLTTNPELAVALIEKGPSVVNLSEMDGKFIV